MLTNFLNAIFPNEREQTRLIKERCRAVIDINCKDKDPALYRKIFRKTNKYVN